MERRAPKRPEGSIIEQIYTAENRPLVGYIKQVLEEEGIRCLIKNEFLGGGVGELPPTECWPELWVIEQSQVGRARQILREILAEDTTHARAWKCGSCGEYLEPQFELCWRCGAARGPSAEA